MKKILVSLLTLSACASLEERLCNQTKAFQNGYEDVLEGRANTPGLTKGEACKKSQNYAYENYYRDYMAGFEKGKVDQCTRETASRLGQADADANKLFQSSLPKLQICMNDRKTAKLGLQNFYETAYRKSFCVDTKMSDLATQDSKDFSTPMKQPSDFAVCAYKGKALYQTYKGAYDAGIRVLCTPAKFAALAVQQARANVAMTQGYTTISNCPADLQTALTQSYTATYQNERNQMTREQLVQMEQQRLQQQNDAQQKLIQMRQQQMNYEMNNNTYPYAR